MASKYPKKINLDFVDQVSYLSGMHRSGWPYVLQQLYKLNNTDAETIWCDTYVDRTFHWSKNAQVPYERPWIGFVHHTFDTEFSDYNNVNLLQNEKFLASLTHCKGLFVFDYVQKIIWDDVFSSFGYNVPVNTLVHPTKTPPAEMFFDMNKFHKNSYKKLVQIGAWLRDNYAIYRLNDGKPKIPLGTEWETIQKAAVKGPKMDHYFKPLNFYRILTRYEWKADKKRPIFDLDPNVTRIVSVDGALPVQKRISDAQDDEGGMCGSIMCRDSDYSLNKYVLGAINLIKEVDNSVVLFPTLSDSEYDKLLAENIVFLKLVDAAAVNTLLECIVRNTPVVVNRLPATMTLLGEDYPLFFNEMSEVPALLSRQQITDAHMYLRQMDKTNLTGEYFLESFVNSEIYQSL